MIDKHNKKQKIILKNPLGEENPANASREDMNNESSTTVNRPF